MPKARVWSPDEPLLYRCRVSVHSGADLLDAEDVLFGCRSFRLHQVDAAPPVYEFKPLRAKWLRILGRGSDRTDWNSIWEVEGDALLHGPDAVRASGGTGEYAPERAIDGRADTRWAAHGKGQWIRFRLDETVTFDRLTIKWYEAAVRRWDFDILVSQDGETWNKVDYRKVGKAAASAYPNGLPMLNGKPLQTPVEKYSTWRRKMSAPAPQDVVAPLPPVKSVSAIS